MTLLFGAIGVYSGFFYDRSPRLTFREIANTSVFDIHREVDELEIRYRGEDLASAGQALSLLQVRVVNDGAAPVLNSYYDLRSLPGLQMPDASLLKAEVVSASSAYLKSNFRVQAERSTVRFQPVILEAEDHVTLEFLLLHDESDEPAPAPVGKIAGIRRMEYVPLEFQNSPSFVERAFYGDLLVQSGRLLGYPVAFIFSILLIGGTIAYASDRVDNVRRRRYVEKALLAPAATQQPLGLLLERYGEHGDAYLMSIKYYLGLRTSGHRAAPLYEEVLDERAIVANNIRRRTFHGDVIKDLRRWGAIDSTKKGGGRVDAEKSAKILRLIEKIQRHQLKGLGEDSDEKSANTGSAALDRRH